MDNEINGTPEVPNPTPAVSDGWHESADGLTVSLYKDNEVVIVQTASQAAYRLNINDSTIERLTARVNTLESEQITGDDYRLADFWAKAQELADEAGHCDVFDQIAEALGGPARVKEYQVTLSFTATWSTTVEARDESDAIEQARESFRYNADEGDFENVDEDRYNAEAEEV